MNWAAFFISFIVPTLALLILYVAIVFVSWFPGRLQTWVTGFLVLLSVSLIMGLMVPV